MIYQSPKDEAQGRALRMLIDRGLKEGEGIQGFVTDIIAELLLALQAKEQELGHAKELLNSVRYQESKLKELFALCQASDPESSIAQLHEHFAGDKRMSDTIHSLTSELAQARQQAIAEQAETVDILKRGLQNAVIYEEKRCYYRTANGVKMEIPKRYEMPIRVAMETIIRSLTPPPPSSASSEARSRTVETTGVSATSQQSATASQSGTRTICGNLLAAAFGNAIECNLRKGHSGICKYSPGPQP